MQHTKQLKGLLLVVDAQHGIVMQASDLDGTLTPSYRSAV